MAGGAGDDTYLVDNVADTVTEAVNEGTDTIETSVTYALPANVENLNLTGTADDQRDGERGEQHPDRERRGEPARRRGGHRHYGGRRRATTSTWWTTPRTRSRRRRTAESIPSWLR